MKRVEKVRNRAKRSHQKLEAQFPSVAQKLRDLGLDLSQLRRHSARVLSASALAGSLLLASPAVSHTTNIEKPATKEKVVTAEESVQKLKDGLAKILPEKVGTPLTPQIETQTHDLIQSTLNIDAVGLLDGNHLNTTYGYMGAEQHLRRYPGDTNEQHDGFWQSGMAPGNGGWGLFAPSKRQMTQEAYMNEKYYVAVQTMYLPNWKKDTRNLSKWYKYRKVLVVNPQNGKAIIADIADAGPAAWTGKQFGGSPEVMAALDLNHGKQKGAVVLFFINDENTTQKVALGPIAPNNGVFLAAR